MKHLFCIGLALALLFVTLTAEAKKAQVKIEITEANCVLFHRAVIALKDNKKDRIIRKRLAGAEKIHFSFDGVPSGKYTLGYKEREGEKFNFNELFRFEVKDDGTAPAEIKLKCVYTQAESQKAVCACKRI